MGYHSAKSLVVRLDAQEVEQKPSVDFGDCERLLEGSGIRNLGRQGGSRDSREVEWHRLLQSAKMSPVLLKVGVPSIAEASCAYTQVHLWSP